MVSFSKAAVGLSFVLLIVYTIAVLIIFARTGSEPEVLTRFFIGAIIGEFGFLSGIRIVKELSLRKHKSSEGEDTIANTDPPSVP